MSRQEVQLEADPRSVALARRFVATTLAAWDLDDLADVALLLTSEVVTNAVRHARTILTVSIEAKPPRVTVAVNDHSPEPPDAKLYQHEGEGGRGLYLVDTLATKWGWRPDSGGKVVWFNLA